MDRGCARCPPPIAVAPIPTREMRTLLRQERFFTQTIAPSVMATTPAAATVVPVCAVNASCMPPTARWPGFCAMAIRGRACRRGVRCRNPNAGRSLPTFAACHLMLQLPQLRRTERRDDEEDDAETACHPACPWKDVGCCLPRTCCGGHCDWMRLGQGPAI